MVRYTAPVMSGYQGDTPLTRFLATLTLGQLREMKADARNEIEAAAARVEELKADLARIEQAIVEKGGRRSVPTPDATRDGIGFVQPPGSMKDHILAVMGERPEGVWTTQQVLDELLKRTQAPGGAKPLNTIGNRLVELARAEKVYRHGRGMFSLTPPRDERLALLAGGGESD